MPRKKTNKRKKPAAAKTNEVKLTTEQREKLNQLYHEGWATWMNSLCEFDAEGNKVIDIHKLDALTSSKGLDRAWAEKAWELITADVKKSKR